MKFIVTNTVTVNNRPYTLYLSGFKKDFTSRGITEGYVHYDYSKDREKAYAYKYDNSTFTRALWGSRSHDKHPAEVNIEKVDGGGAFGLLGCSTVLPDRFIGGSLQYTKNSVLQSDDLPNPYEVTGGKVPIYNGKYRHPRLLAYSNLIYPALNVGIVGKITWSQIHKLALDFLKEIREDKRGNKGWASELKSMGALSSNLKNMYVVITGNNTEMWALGYLAANGVGDPETNDKGEKIVPLVGPKVSSDPKWVGHDTFHLNDFITVNVPLENEYTSPEMPRGGPVVLFSSIRGRL